LRVSDLDNTHLLFTYTNGDVTS